MKLVSRLLARRQALKLKSAKSLSGESLVELQDELVECGADAFPALTECLSHPEARGPAIEVLERSLNNETFDDYVQALASANPAVVSGVGRALAGGKGFDPSRLLGALALPLVKRSVLETALLAHAKTIPVDRMMAALSGLQRDGQIVIFRLLEKAVGNGTERELLPLLGHEDSWLRTQALRIVSHYPSEVMVRGVVAMLGDKQSLVRLAAVEGLHQMGAKTAVPALMPLLKDGDLQVQSAAIDALRALADENAVPNLISLLGSDVEQHRRAAVEVLNAVATPAATQDLVRALRDHDWWVRVRASDALGAMGGDLVVQAAVGLLSDEDQLLRRHAIEILVKVPDQRAVDALLRALEDTDWWVRERAIDALGKARDSRAIEPLITRLKRLDRTAALCARALAAIGGSKALEALLAVFRDATIELRTELLPALREFAPDSIGDRERSDLSEILRSFRPSSSSASGFRTLPREGEPHTPTTPRTPLRTGIGTASDAVNRANFSDLPVGTLLLERFRVVRKIGRGGFGTVYLVEDSAIHEELILKILDPQLSLDETSSERFVRELKLTRRITHPSVIRIHDFLDLGGSYAVSMEFFPSLDLGKLLARDGRIRPARALRILRQVCEGLAAAHAVGVIHRDIKPANLLVGDGDISKIVDFGLASAQQQAGSRLTRSGLLIGTPEYMAPEQISGGEVDYRADLYSLGIVMYEMLSGTRPYVAETPVKVLFKHLEGGAEPLERLVPEMPPGLSDLVSAAMAKDASERPANAETLRAGLDHVLGALEEAA